MKKEYQVVVGCLRDNRFHGLETLPNNIKPKIGNKLTICDEDRKTKTYRVTDHEWLVDRYYNVIHFRVWVTELP